MVVCFRNSQKLTQLPSIWFIINSKSILVIVSILSEKGYFYLFFIEFFIYISNVIPCPVFPSIKPLSRPHPPSSIRVSPTQPRTPSHLPALTFPHTGGWEWGGSSLGRTKGFPSLWCPTRPSSATYAAGVMGLSMCTLLMMV